MKPLSQESRALLDAVRGREGPSIADRDRIRGKITARIAAGLALGSAVTASATVAEAAHVSGLAAVAAWLPAAAKVLSVVAIAGGVTVGAVRVSQHASAKASQAVPSAISRERPETRVVEPSIALPLAGSARADEPASRPTEPHVSPSVTVCTRAPSTIKHEASAAVVPTPVEGAAPADPPLDDGLTGQISAIRDARTAIRRGDGAAALAALNRGFVAGQSSPLAQEAALVRVSAYCAMGDLSAARRTAEQFLVNYPASPLGSKIRSSCAFP